MSSIIGERLTSIAQTIERRLDDEMTPFVLGEGLQGWSKKIAPEGERVTVGALVHLAVLNDALIVAERAAMKDGVLTPEEKAYVTPLAQMAVRYLAHFRRFYQEFADGVDAVDVKEFIDAHMEDRQPFGGKSSDTLWTGAQICKNFAASAGDRGPLGMYRDTMVRLVDDIFDLTTGSDPAWQKDLRAEIELRSRLERSDESDARRIAFCAPADNDVFHAVTHAGEVHETDPFDVEGIHVEARDAFTRALQRISNVNRPSKRGSMLLVRGESGAGKTHLMRAFRGQVHEHRLGHVGYLQMTSTSGSYTRHILSSLVDSLERPYVQGEPSSLSGIADSLMRWRVPAELSAQLREEPEPGARGNIVGRIVDHLVTQPAFSSIDVDLIRAFIYFATNDAVVESRVKRYLRCEPLSDYDRQHLGGISPSTDENAPLRTVVGIGKLIAASHGGALVLLVDQLEDVYEKDVAQARFRNLMDALRLITEQVPSSLAVIACLEDFYEELRKTLTRSLLDRLELDPPPARIVAARSREEVEQLVALRLRALLGVHGARVHDDEPLWPFAPNDVAQLAGLRSRDVLDWCRSAHESCVAAGRIVTFARLPPGHAAPPVPSKPLAAEWTKHQAEFQMAAGNTSDETHLSSLLGWSFRHVARESDVTLAVSTTDPLEVTVGPLASGESAKKSVVAICNAAPQGGRLGKQVEALSARADAAGARAVIVRCSDFPKSHAKSAVAERMGNLVKTGGAKVFVRDTDWRALAAVRAFVEAHSDSSELAVWLRDERVVSKLECVKAMLGTELPRKAGPLTTPPPPTPRAEPTPGPASAQPNAPVVRASESAPRVEAARPVVVGANRAPIFLGRTRSLQQSDVSRDTSTFVRHAAFLGSAGSGKTTLALNIVEQCLLQGVPALLVDRKGDLCRYATDEFWNEVEAEPSRATRKRELRERMKVQVFTPGAHKGRPLALPIVPPGLAELDPSERSTLAASAAAGLGSMMAYRNTQAEAARLAILAKALELLAELGGKKDIEIDHLIAFIAEEDPILLDAIGSLDPKHFKALTDHLSTLRLRHAPLLRGGELLNAELLLGLGPFATPGKTNLSIVSTKFLSDPSVVDFWVSRLLIELTRWSSRHPANRLQAIVLLDEADIYLPAMSKPATKQPMQDLLRRARSAGLGVFLATQSPGDLDYKCRDNITSWFVGKIQQTTSIEKMKPLLSDYRSNPAGKLASAGPGEFFVLAEGDVVELKADRAIMKTDQLSEDQILAASRL